MNLNLEVRIGILWRFENKLKAYRKNTLKAKVGPYNRSKTREKPSHVFLEIVIRPMLFNSMVSNNSICTFVCHA